MPLSDREMMLIAVQAEDAASATINRVQGTVAGLSNTLRSGSLRMFAYSQAAETVGRGMVRFGMVTTAAGIAAGKAYMDFGHSMALANTQAQMSEQQLEKTGDAVLKISSRFGVAGTEIADGLYDIYSTTDQRGKEALKSATALTKASVAGATEMRTATRGVIDIQNAFGKSAGNTNHVLDLQFKMLRESGGTYEELVSGFGNVIGAARQTNQELETVAGSIAFLTLRGRTQAQASISVSRALDQLSKSAKDVKDTLGVAVFDAKGNFRQLNDIITDMAEKMKGMTDKERVKAFEDMFGAGSIQANRFFRTAVLQADALNKKVQDMTHNQGELNTQLGIMQDMDPSLQWKKLWEQIKNTGIALMQDVWPAVKDIIKVFKDWIDSFNKLSPATKELITKIVLIGGVVALVGGKILLMASSVMRLISIFRLASRASSGAASGIANVGNSAQTAATKATAASSTFKTKLVSGLRGAAGTAGIIVGSIFAEQFIRNAIQSASWKPEDVANKIVPVSAVNAIEQQLDSRLGHLTLGDINPFNTKFDKTNEAVKAYTSVVKEAVAAGIPLEVAQQRIGDAFEDNLNKLGGWSGGIDNFKDGLRQSAGLIEDADGKVRIYSQSLLKSSQAQATFGQIVGFSAKQNSKAGNTLAGLVQGYTEMVGPIDTSTASMLHNLVQMGDYRGAIRLLRGEFNKNTKDTLQNMEATNKNARAAGEADRAQKGLQGTVQTTGRNMDTAKGQTDHYSDAIKNVPKECRTVVKLEKTAAEAALRQLYAMYGNKTLYWKVSIAGGLGGHGAPDPNPDPDPPGKTTPKENPFDRHTRGTTKTKSGITINTKTDATADEIVRELDWAMRTRGY